jgi:hypothetical protein
MKRSHPSSLALLEAVPRPGKASSPPGNRSSDAHPLQVQDSMSANNGPESDVAESLRAQIVDRYSTMQASGSARFPGKCLSDDG